MNIPIHIAFACCFITMSAWSQTGLQRNYDIDFTTGITALQNDNANLADESNPNAPDPLSELQLLYELGLAAELQREWTQVELGYLASLRQFQEDSQNDQDLWTGTGRITVGNEAFPLQLNAFHSVNELVRSTGNPENEDDTERQQRLEAGITAEVFESSRNRIALNSDYGETQTDNTPLNDTEQIDLGFLWTHNLSNITDISINHIYSDIDFDFGDVSDFKMHATTINVERRMRRLTWGVTLGNTAVEPLQGDTYSEPIYGMNLGLDLNRHTIQINAIQQIIDSAQLNNTNANIVPDDILVGSQAQGQVLSLQLTANWAYSFCQRCQLVSNITYGDNEFQNASDNDFVSQIVNVNFSYQLSRLITTNIGYRSNKIEYGQESALIGVDRRVSTINLNYLIVDNLQTRFFIIREDWENSINAEYVANSYGIGVSYTW